MLNYNTLLAYTFTTPNFFFLGETQLQKIV